MIRRLEIHEQSGNVRTVTLRGLDLSPSIDPATFVFKVPAGARVRGGLGGGGSTHGPRRLGGGRPAEDPMRLRTRDLPVFPVSAGPVRPEVSPHVRAVDPRSFAVGPADGPLLGLVTLGCDKNTVDSEHMMAALVSAGARVTSDVENAEVVVVNTCGFIDAAKEQSIDTILSACELKARGQVRAVVAVGCMVQRYRAEMEQEIPEVDLFLGIAEMGRLVPELRARGLVDEAFVPTMERPLRILTSETRHVSYLKVSEGVRPPLRLLRHPPHARAAPLGGPRRAGGRGPRPGRTGCARAQRDLAGHHLVRPRPQAPRSLRAAAP